MAKTYNTISTFTAGQVLTAAQMNDLGENSNNYRVPPMCKATRNGNLSYTNNTVIAWNDTAYDTETATPGSGGMHDDVTNNTRITPVTAGVYLVVFSVNFTFSGTSSNFQSTILLNGAEAANDFYDVVRTTLQRNVLSGVFEMNGTTDYLEAKFTIGGGTSPNITAGTLSYLSATWLGQVS